MRHTESFLYGNQSRSDLFSREFCENTSGRLLLLRLKCKVNEFTYHFHGLSVVCVTNHIRNNTVATTAENLKFYNKWTVRSIFCLRLHIKIDFSFVKLVINSTCVRLFIWSWLVSVGVDWKSGRSWPTTNCSLDHCRCTCMYNYQFRFEPADYFCSKLTVQRRDQECNNI